VECRSSALFEHLFADENDVLSLPERLDPAGVAPFLCAGITTYSPLCHWQVEPGMKLGIVDIGGLDHVAVRLARAMGAEVTAFTTSSAKVEDARKLSAHHVVVSSDPEQMAALAGGLDFILDTVSVVHDLDPHLMLLRRDATLCLVGVPADRLSFSAVQVIIGRNAISGSPPGGIAERRRCSISEGIAA